MLRDYQHDLKSRIYNAWAAGASSVLAVAPTGGGKGVIIGSILNECDRPARVIAHRSEIVSQLALVLNRERVPHNIIAAKSLVKEIIRLEHETHGYSTFAWRAPIAVTGVDTFIRSNDKRTAEVSLAIVDEAHHVAGGNKWMRALDMMPGAKVAGFTAHAIRADGQGLGRHADGVFDELVVGPCARDLISRGFLTDFRMRIPPSDADFSDVPIGSTGDYSTPQLRAATHKAKRLVGDIVSHFKEVAGPDSLGLSFAVDIEAANELCMAYRKAGVPTQIVTGKTSIHERAAIMRQFRNRQVRQLVSVDVLGEGTDVPSASIVSFGRRTASFQLMSQQLGRALRVDVADELAARWGEFTDAERLAHIAASPKPYATVNDHVGNLIFHHATRGFPDSRQAYTLDREQRRARGKRDGEIPLRPCMECYQPYERFYTACPYCGAVPQPAGRSTPEQVDGDLIELNAGALNALRQEVARIDGPVRLPATASPVVARAITNRHHARYSAQQSMRAVAALWGGYYRARGETDRQIQKRFYFTFNIDVLTARSQNAQNASLLEARIQTELDKLNVIGDEHE